MVDGAGVRLHVAEAGEGPPVLLLHGFPDFWYGWRLQMPALARAGYRAVAPDLRGYNRSDRPAGRGSYRLSLLVQDAAALIRELNVGPVPVVGHDWGGLIAWSLAEREPELVSRLVVVNAPHPDAFRRRLADPRQLARAWYVILFQLPWLPEALLRARDFRALAGVYVAQRRHGAAFSAEDIALYKEVFREPGALTAALNYYRRTARVAGKRTASRRRTRIEVPTRVFWGQPDPALRDELLRGLERWAPRVRVQTFPGAGHWPHLASSASFNEALLAFLEDTE